MKKAAEDRPAPEKAPEPQRKQSDIAAQMRKMMRPHNEHHLIENIPTRYNESRFQSIEQERLYNKVMNLSTGRIQSDPAEVKRMIADMFEPYPRLLSAYHRGEVEAPKAPFRRQPSSSAIDTPTSVVVDYGHPVELANYSHNGIPQPHVDTAVHEFHLPVRRKVV